MRWSTKEVHPQGVPGYGAMCESNQSGHQLMGVVKSGVGDLHRLQDGSIQAPKLYLMTRTGNTFQKGRGKNRQAGAKNREDEVQRSVYMKNLTM